MELPRLWLTTGEPAGIGPELALDFAREPVDAQLILIGDPDLLQQRADCIGMRTKIRLWQPGISATPDTGALWVYPVPLSVPSHPGVLDRANAHYVIEVLRVAADGCMKGEGDAMITAPVSKAIISDAGYEFTGHTEFLAEHCGGRPVMMLVAGHLRVALATTHLPLRSVAEAITRTNLEEILRVIDRDLRIRFGIKRPKIRVCGLNPHAGEDGHLGSEEHSVIVPAIMAVSASGIDVAGPFPADSLLTPARWSETDIVLAMYHDQGLPPLKYAGFGHGVNVTLGLPIIRTSVDHGTALDLAGTGRASPTSLRAAVEMAASMVRNRIDN